MPCTLVDLFATYKQPTQMRRTSWPLTTHVAVDARKNMNLSVNGHVLATRYRLQLKDALAQDWETGN